MSDSCCQLHLNLATLEALQRRVLIWIFLINVFAFRTMVGSATNRGHGAGPTSWGKAVAVPRQIAKRFIWERRKRCLLEPVPPTGYPLQHTLVGGREVSGLAQRFFPKTIMSRILSQWDSPI